MTEQVPTIPIRLTGKSKIYRGAKRLQIAMPLGGIGTGSVCLNGEGGLQDFSIRHAPDTTAMPDETGDRVNYDAAFALLHLPLAGVTRLVEGPLPPEKIFDQGLKAQGYRAGGHEGLPRFRQCSFKGEYPFGQVRLSDPLVPLQVTITAFNPFIPLDDRNSGIPCAILEYSLHNPSPQTVPYQFSYHVSHFAPGHDELRAGTSRNAAIPGTGIYLFNEEDPASAHFGSAALGVVGHSPRIKAMWFRGGWFDSISALWREVSSGTFSENDGSQAALYAAQGEHYRDDVKRRNGGSILVEGSLQPRQRVSIPIILAWHFPNVHYEFRGTQSQTLDQSTGARAGECGCRDGNYRSSPKWRPWYAAQWKNAREVLFYVKQNYAELRRRTLAFHHALHSSSLPSPALEAVSANLAILKSPTVLRQENGTVWAWEGCYCDRGCCRGSCTHVWNYAQAMAHLYPPLERSLRHQELLHSMDEDGHVNFRSSLPDGPTDHLFHAAADGQLGGIMKVYREWQISGDRQWLERMYPFAKRSLDYCIHQWDPRRVGALEEPHHNTYDIEFWGPDGMCGSFYLGALAAMIALARESGHPEDIPGYEELQQRAVSFMDEHLFNGEYYQQKVQWEGLNDTSFSQRLQNMQAPFTEEDRLLQSEGPKYQYGSGCLSDSVFGAWLARQCFLHSAQTPHQVRQTLQSIFRYNFKTSLWEHANPQRPGYALGGEAGLLLCTWPRGAKPTLPFVYSDEVWTGIEYQVAAHMISEGMVDEGLAIVRAVRSRYDGHVRNPWNEYECGSYYARAMASYGLLQALTGFQYSSSRHALRLAPRLPLPLRCFFSTASGWGQFNLLDDRLEINLQEGSLALETLDVELPDGRVELPLKVTVHAGTSTIIHFL